MRLELIRKTAVVFLVALAADAVRADDQKTAGNAEKGANPDAVVLADFQERVRKYVELHKDAAKGAPRLKETEDPAKIREAQVALAREIAGARKDARPGDIFTPEIRARFRRLMYPELKGVEGRETKEEIKEDKPTKPVPLKVNALYPEGEPLPTMPPNVLQNLPQLPEELEYRIIGETLILRDVKANIIVDFIPNAFK
jgi:hypothetical protein